ncbi:MAG TPA: hypothetical protein HA247_04410 [Candidatus Thalassarchaeaceae archaeon]|nr:hypothetical protein [Euryarchaeota archaeon]DAC43244.1 MAG TPA: hypothetical protein D7H98_04445 [Candidatus Poseidoniales archaeon]HII90240.1 hypothetical protein [Candidatus Thalassarchaeaceae archaeon]|tara:strand:- start:9188 stop:10396 length:1209 start_codon:yes stop_codon:yes gene_type:complete
MSDSDRPRIVDSEAGGSRIADDGESFRRLVTPEIVCDFRAAQVSISRIPEGFVLDPAAGSGGQLAAYGKRLGKSCVGVELSPRRAVHCANSLSTLGGDIDTLAICGDGLDSEGVMSIVREKMRDVKISMLHVDPARPLDAQNHSISEMEPPLRPLLEAWSDYLESGELGVSLLLDLSPRLAPKQRMEVEAIVRELFPGVNLTWEWLSRGGGRVDRLTVHTGGLAQEDGGVRCVRLHRDGSFDALSGKAGDYHAEWVDIDPVVGEILALVDPVVTQSGLRMAYEKGAGQGGRVKWVHDSDRRPMAILDEELPINCTSRAFTPIHGRVEERIEGSLNLMMLDSLAASAMRCGLSKVQIRCACDPKMHTKIVNRLDSILGETEGEGGFLVDAPGGNSLFLCKKLP